MSVRVRFANFAEDSFASDYLADDGTTLAQFLDSQDVDVDEGNFRISVNGQEATRDYLLHDNDRVRLTPRKMKGAA
jgi:hypothetical protein